MEVEKVLNPNPNPHNFKVQQTLQLGKLTIAQVVYPDCTNYEGNKILVFELTAEQVRDMKVIDPHFSRIAPHLSPIARFVPTERGWEMALNFAKIVHQLETIG